MLIRGRRLLMGSLFFVIAAAIGLFFVFRLAIHHRFAVGVYALGETPDIRGPRKLWFIDLNRGQPLPSDKPLVVWIEGGTAGKTALRGWVYLISDTGELLAPVRQLTVKKNQAGRVVEEAIFKSPRELHAGRSIGVVVMRIPHIDQAAAINDQVAYEVDYLHSQFGRIAKLKALCAEFNGYSEYVIVYVASEKK